MKTLLSVRAACAALMLGVAASPAFAQTTNAPTSTAPTSTPSSCTGGWKHHRLSVLTDAERAQLMKAHQAAIAANPGLRTQQETLQQQFASVKTEGTSATPDQHQALHQQAHAFRKQLRSAELLIDPTLAPVFAKLDAAKHHHNS